jgi:hypothetical protein
MYGGADTWNEDSESRSNSKFKVKFKVDVIIWPTVSRPISPGIRRAIFLSLIWKMFPNSCDFELVGRTPSREEGYLIYPKQLLRVLANTLTLRSKYLSAHDHILQCHLRLNSLLVPSFQPAGPRWRYSIPSPHRTLVLVIQLRHRPHCKRLF